MKRISVGVTLLQISLASPSLATAFVQTTVTQDLISQAYNFEVDWSAPADFTEDSLGRPADAARFLILSRAVADACCGPYGNWSGFASANAAYSIFLPTPTDQVSVYTGFMASSVGNVVFSINGDAIDFSIPFDWINEPNPWMYEFESYNHGAWAGQAYIGRPDGLPSSPIGSVPELSSWAMMVLGFAGLALWGKRRKSWLSRTDFPAMAKRKTA